MPIEVIAQPYGTAARDALWERLVRLQRDDPVHPVTVAVPSNYAGLSLRRALVREHGGLLNVRFLVFPRVTELLGAPLLAARGEQPLTPALGAELVRAALEEHPGSFAEVAAHPATVRSLEAAFRELADLSDSQLDALAATSTRSSDLVRLFRATRERSRGNYYDVQDLAAAAAEAVQSDHPALRDVGDLVLFLPGPLSRAEQAFITAFATAATVAVIVGLTGDEAADAFTREHWARWWPDAVEAGTVLGATEIVSAPDPEEEVRQAIRMMVAEAEQGQPFHRVALLSRHARPYDSLAPEQLSASGIPWNGPNPRTLAQSATGRALLGLLALPEQQFSRRAVTNWLAAAPVLETAGGALAPAHRWGQLARAAGVVSGEEEWRSRLDAYARHLRSELESLPEDDEASAWRRPRIEGDLAALAKLRRFIAELFDATDAIDAGDVHDWPGFAGWARRLVDRYLGGEGQLTAHVADDAEAEAEIETYRAVVEAIDGLGQLGAIHPTVDVAVFRRALERELERRARRIGRYGSGVFVGRLRDAVGADFDRIFMLGMNEGSVPARASDEPLLPEAEWKTLNHPVSRRSRQLAEERRHYLAALASAPRRALVAPRADLRGQQARLRSRWLLESATALEGTRLTDSDLETLGSRAWHTVVSSFEGALAGAAPAASLEERDLRALHRWRAEGRPLAEHPLAATSPLLAEGWEAQRARRGATHTRWDGLVDGAGGAPPQVLARPLGPTSLERWATCPRRFLFANVLRVAERDEPESLLTISPAERGTLLHAALQAFLDERRPADPTTPWTDDDRARMRAIGEEHCDRWQTAGLTGKPLLWQLERQRILRDLDDFLGDDLAHRDTRGVVPIATEVAFGEDAAVAVDLGEGRTIALRGRIDRVDRSPDGSRLVVIDYKSGTSRGYKDLAEDPVLAGRLLQLPAYALAAEAQFGTGAVEAYYWFLRHTETDRLVGYAVDERVQSRFRQALTSIATGIAAGAFTADPGTSDYRAGERSSHENCRYCPYDPICPADRAAARDRKQGDPALEPFNELASPPASPEGQP